MILTALALTTLIQSDRWIPVGDGTNAHEEYVDKESISRSGSKVTLWTRRDFRAEQATSWKELEFDCSARTETLVAYIRDDRGVVSHNMVRPHRAAAPIPPASAEERIFNIACR